MNKKIFAAVTAAAIVFCAVAANAEERIDADISNEQVYTKVVVQSGDDEYTGADTNSGSYSGTANGNEYVQQGSEGPFSFCDWYVITSTYSEGIAMHPEPDKDSDVLGRISYGERFPVFAYDGNYGFTIHDSAAGWINLDYADNTEYIFYSNLRDTQIYYNLRYSEENDDADWYIILSDYEPGIALHPSPDKDSDVIGRLYEFTYFPVYEYDGNYGYTCSSGEWGWVNLKYALQIYDPDIGVFINPDYEYDFSDSDDEISEDTCDWYVITSTYADGIAMHPEPDPDSDVINRIPYGEYFPVYELVDGTTYGYTEYEGIYGYINLDYAEFAYEEAYDSDIGDEDFDDADAWYDADLPQEEERELLYSEEEADELMYLYAEEQFDTADAYWDCYPFEDTSGKYNTDQYYCYSVTSYTGAQGVFYLNMYSGDVYEEWEDPEGNMSDLTYRVNLYDWAEE